MKKKGRPRHHLYTRNSIEIYPGSLRDRSVERLGEGATDNQIKNDLRVGGLMAEEFVDDGRSLENFSKNDGRRIFWLMRQAIIEQGRIGDPIPNKELESIAVREGFFRIRARFALRDAWKMGLSRRFVRGVWIWAHDGESKGGTKFGIHYILSGSGNVF